MGYGNNAGCGTSGTPMMQNIQSSLIDMRGFSTPAGLYWSSTENSSVPKAYAWGQLFISGGGSGPDVGGKFIQFGVRCSRSFT
jgi:hypothetical protein